MEDNNLVKLRPHHFFDIIRSFGRDDEIKPHSYGHSFHKVAAAIRDKPDLQIRIVKQCDSVCKGCLYCQNGLCGDSITHRKDFVSKEKFNNYLDQRIMEKCSIIEGSVFIPPQLYQKADCYLENIDWIYLGNDKKDIIDRKADVKRGLKHISEKLPS